MLQLVGLGLAKFSSSIIEHYLVGFSSVDCRWLVSLFLSVVCYVETAIASSIVLV